MDGTTYGADMSFTPAPGASAARYILANILSLVVAFATILLCAMGLSQGKMNYVAVILAVIAYYIIQQLIFAIFT